MVPQRSGYLFELNRETKEEKTLEQGKNQQQIQPINNVGSRILTRATLVGGDHLPMHQCHAPSLLPQKTKI